jgi:hypothetical protein
MRPKLGISTVIVVLLLILTAWQPFPPAEPIIQAEAGPLPAAAQFVPYTPAMKVLFEEMTLVWLQAESYAHVQTVCAGNGLQNIKPLPDGPMILIPNAGDLSVEGSNVSIKLTPEGEISFIPRVQGQKIRVPLAVGDKLKDQEVLSLSLAEAMQLMAADKLIWTARDQGPYGNGHGLPGHIAECDPQYDPEGDF